jgi:glyoxylase-like metal-dependent hydrolase (beta-lactamase superfamily II)
MSDAGTLRLSDDLFVVRIPGEANVVAQTDAKGVLLVDGAPVPITDEITGLPEGGAVHTIFIPIVEQTGLNERLGKAGAPIIAQENTRLWLTQNITWPWNGQRFARLPKIAQPTKTFYTTGRLESDVRYGYIPDAAHTDGDLYVHFPKQNVLAVGDAVSGQGWPVIDWWTGGWIGGIVGGLQRLQTLANADTRIVPARGPVLGLEDLKAQYEMYGTIYDRLSQMLNKGAGRPRPWQRSRRRNSTPGWESGRVRAARSRACGRICRRMRDCWPVEKHVQRGRVAENSGRGNSRRRFGTWF